jgi:hypothetical protein
MVVKIINKADTVNRISAMWAFINSFKVGKLFITQVKNKHMLKIKAYNEYLTSRSSKNV